MFVPSCETINCYSAYKPYLKFVHNYSIKLENGEVVSQYDMVLTTCGKFKEYSKKSIFSDRLKYEEVYNVYNRIINCNVNLR